MEGDWEVSDKDRVKVLVMIMVTMVMVMEECSRSRQGLRQCRMVLMDCKEVFRQFREDSIMV